MKVVVVSNGGGLDNLQVVERADPTPKPNEVIVKWHATSLNYHDYLVGAGAIPVLDGRIPMSDGAGEIIAIGSDVSAWKAGDKVMSIFFPFWVEGKATFRKMVGVSGETVDGYIAEQSAVSASAISAMPEGFSYAEAATLPCAGLTAWRGLIVEGKIKAGESVLIEGSGGMSILGLQLAKMA
ncbi:MAG: NADPH:quinone reductase-like Zn-dependent oxidoreductase, partial [Saprospiraceae bacterium]